ncbi:MAG: homocysteine S-methyltransferase family protein [Clostridia bacterium]|nr:homocysteine S-methyltransferase family protein [Clostridia bacterium]
MNFSEYLKNNIVYLDGGMGTLLQAGGLKPGEHPEKWNISHPEIITDIHKSYFSSGSNVVCTNTFGANSLKFSDDELEEIIKSAINNAKKAKELSDSTKEKFIALDIGPTGKLLKPLGDLDFEDAVNVFSKTVKLGVKYGVDLVLIETMNDSYETKAALLAVKENCGLPVLVSNAYNEDGKLMTGASPAAMVALLEGMGATAIGANCSLGPKQLTKVAEELLENASVPVLLKPNAGLPEVNNGKTRFNVTPEEFSGEVTELIKKGLRVVGGCCGTTPEHIKALTEKSKNLKPLKITNKNLTVVSSYTKAVKFLNSPILIGERINPTGKKRFKQALIENDIAYILNEGVNQQEKGVHILDVNVGLPDINEIEILKKTVEELQSVIDLPLQIDTADVVAMENALRIYNGKALINSVNGKKESMNAIFPLVKKYGGVVVALTLDENGIPETAEGRVEIAKNILSVAKEYGIEKNNIIFDTLAMTISADQNAANETLKALNIIKNQLGCHTSLGVSNVSFGLPNRDVLNSVFFALALENGLSGAIMNPYSDEMMKTYYTFKALKGLDDNCQEYVNVAANFSSTVIDTNKTATQVTENSSELQYAVIKGFKEKASEITKELLKTKAPLQIVNGEIIPALNEVGIGFENKTIYLPQLLMSAESAKSAFEVIKEFMSGSEKTKSKGTFVIATVHGDIHDIGKNIVKLLLENYGFDVIDLGKDVLPEVVVKTVIETKAKLVGLSALMTTTVPAMEETIKLLKSQAPWCKVVVGGAVLTQEYADKIGADKYAKDAMETVRFAENELNINN